MQIEMLADYSCVCGEGPLYHARERAVYWTDIDTGRLFRFDTESREYRQIYQGDPVGGFTVQADGSLLLFMDRGAVRVFRDGAIVKTLIDEIPAERDSRFNDVIADPQGRVFCGTMPTGETPGRLYRLDTDGTLTVVLEGIGCSNGMAFTADRKTMYYTDSATCEIFRFAYDETTGAISDREVVVVTDEANGVPDGMTLDTEGNLWTAKWDGYGVECYSPEGTLLYKLEMPVKICSSCIFGGPEYDDLYVTTAGGDRKDLNGGFSGALFRVRDVTLNGRPVRGVAEYESRIGL
ncbi:MAG: SMP-30/gluconolactonase/LRE family protein [Capsulimonadales bacterium]|nr:SMP-30/gluconolactonase/LRE family protein [Capsulimonadales bacterium]